MWIHSSNTANAAALVIAQHCRGQFFDVTGSDGRNTSHISHTREKRISRLVGVDYHRVVLGSKNGRWLTNTEISNGVLEAITKRLLVFVVGE